MVSQSIDWSVSWFIGKLIAKWWVLGQFSERWFTLAQQWHTVAQPSVTHYSSIASIFAPVIVTLFLELFEVLGRKASTSASQSGFSLRLSKEQGVCCAAKINFAANTLAQSRELQTLRSRVCWEIFDGSLRRLAITKPLNSIQRWKKRINNPKQRAENRQKCE